MTIGSFVRTRPVPVLYGLMIASLLALLPLPPPLQDQAYHQFADQRESLASQTSGLLFKSAIVAVGESVRCDSIAT